MSKIISGILVSIVGAGIASFAFSDSCSSEIMEKAVPLIGMLPGSLFAWWARVTQKDSEPVNVLGVKK
jgi:hypothetical protein